jgi:hypothetical protein
VRACTQTGTNAETDTNTHRDTNTPFELRGAPHRCDAGVISADPTSVRGREGERERERARTREGGREEGSEGGNGGGDRGGGGEQFPMI